MTTLRNEKYQCMYVPERADEVCTMLLTLLGLGTGLSEGETHNR